MMFIINNKSFKVKLVIILPLIGLMCMYFSMLILLRQNTLNHNIQYDAYVFLEQIAGFSDYYYEEYGKWPKSVSDLEDSFEAFEIYIRNKEFDFPEDYYVYSVYNEGAGFGEVMLSENYINSLKANEAVVSFLESMSIRFPMDENIEWNLKYSMGPR